MVLNLDKLLELSLNKPSTLFKFFLPFWLMMFLLTWGNIYDKEPAANYAGKVLRDYFLEITADFYKVIIIGHSAGFFASFVLSFAVVLAVHLSWLTADKKLKDFFTDNNIKLLPPRFSKGYNFDVGTNFSHHDFSFGSLDKATFKKLTASYPQLKGLTIYEGLHVILYILLIIASFVIAFNV